MQMTASRRGWRICWSLLRIGGSTPPLRFGSRTRCRKLPIKEADRVILDLSHVEFLDSSGLGAVVGSMKQLGRARKLDLAALTPTVEKVFRITRMDRVFRIFPTIEAAFGEVTDA